MSKTVITPQVVYVEPNVADDFMSYESSNLGQVYKSTDLEDLCIVVSLEVEVKGRTYATSKSGNDQNIKLEWQSGSNGEKVSFMTGSKIYTDKQKDKYVRSLTTNYTDCHLFDIENDGTCEMFGIKSIDINYTNFMVPDVTIQFVDVRGVSLFAQEEMRHHLSEGDRNGIADNDIEGSFFKCFFTFPYPKFTLRVKGFYGQMVSYELTCSDFRASFDSNTGNFNVTAKFIGYAFSFLTDVMVNALVAAPYSEYIGKKYWEENVKNGRFSLLNKDGSPAEMKKLGYICNKYKMIQKEVSEIIKNKSDAELAKMAGESEEVQKKQGSGDISSLRQRYQELIDALKDAKSELEVKEGDAFINPSGTNDICIITEWSNDKLNKLVDQFKAFNDDELSKSEYLESFSDLKTWVSNNGRFELKHYKYFADVVDDNHKVKADVATGELSEAIYNKGKDRPPSECNHDTYYDAWTDYDLLFGNDFSSSHVYIYQDHGLEKVLGKESDVVSDNEKEQSEIRKRDEQAIMSKCVSEAFDFEPSVENITKVIMAHVETFIEMVHRCSDNIIGMGMKRSIGSMGVSIENCPDAAGNDSTGKESNIILAPFPRVTKKVERDGAKKDEDVWIGDVQGFNKDNAEEISLIEGLLTGINEVANDLNTITRNGDVYTESPKNGIGYPLTYFDLFVEKGQSVFGKTSLTHVEDVFARFCVRAFAVMATQDNDADPATLGKLDAENFYEEYKGNPGLTSLASALGGITEEDVFKFVSTNDGKLEQLAKSKPWYTVKRLISEVGSRYELLAGRYSATEKKNAIPIRDWSFLQLRNTASIARGLVSKNLSNFVTTTCEGNDSTVSIIKSMDAPIQYLKRSIAQLSSSNSKIANEVFEGGFDFKGWNGTDYFGSRSAGFIMYKNNDGETYESADEALSYDEDGNVKEAERVALNLSDFFFNKNRMSMSGIDRASYFIREVMPHPNRQHYYKFQKEKPSFYYMPRFVPIQIGACLLENEKNGKVEKDLKLRTTIRNFFKKQFEDWAKSEYPKIEAEFSVMSQFKDKQDFDTLKTLLDAGNGTEDAVFEALKKTFRDVANIKEKYIITKYNKRDGLQLRPRLSNAMADVVRNLMKVTGVCTLTKFNYVNEEYVKDSDLWPHLYKGHLTGYFRGVIETLKEKLKDSQETKSGHEEAPDNRDENEIKIGVYAYVKMLYDKWIASNTQDKFYRIDNLFDPSNPTFHFVDSVYNNVGRTMYLDLSNLVSRIIESQYKNGYSLLSLLSGLYADNKFTFLCVQNFLDLAHDDLLEKMFKPVPFIDIKMPDNHPDFIVLYPYEPSSKLDVAGADYPDDGFYLNNQETWPELVRGKSGSPIPSFGVSYGQQYQNYFKDIQVDMSSPMTTEQSIRAKFMIAGQNSGTDNNGARQITAGQDLFTIYSNNSYTCTVTMMGCAWVQPMMYFVLQNVPMFRGSYMIVKVNHQIQAGNMTTTFKGVRMSKNATKTAERFLYGATSDSVGRYSGTDRIEGSNANIANDCAYSYYDPSGTSVISPDSGEPSAYCKAAYDTFTQKAGLTPAQAMGICANIYAESGFDPYIINIDGNKSGHGVGGGLCGFYYNGMAIDLFKFVYPTDWRQKLDDINAKVEPYWNGTPCSPTTKKKLRSAGIKFPISFEQQMAYLVNVIGKSPYNKIATARSSEEATRIWQEVYERPQKITERWSGKNGHGSKVEAAIRTTNTVKKNDTSATSGKTDDEMMSGFTAALQSTLKSNLNYNRSIVSLNKKTANGWFWVSATGNNATNALFDIVISTYSSWCDIVNWDVGSNASNSDATAVKIHLAKGEPTKHEFYVISNGNNAINITTKEGLNESLRLSMAKYFKTHSITDPQKAKAVFRPISTMDDNLVKEVFELGDVKSITDCGSVLGAYAGGSVSVDSVKISNASVAESNSLSKDDITARKNALFNNKVPNSDAEMAPYLETFTVRGRTMAGKDTNLSVRLHKALKENFTNIANELYANGFSINNVATYAWRNTDKGKRSNHSYGVAIDINPGPMTGYSKLIIPGSAGDNPKNQYNPYWNGYHIRMNDRSTWTKGSNITQGTSVESRVRDWDSICVKTFAKYGWGWGGAYGDVMHFSFFGGH